MVVSGFLVEVERADLDELGKHPKLLADPTTPPPGCDLIEYYTTEVNRNNQGICSFLRCGEFIWLSSSQVVL